MVKNVEAHTSNSDYRVVTFSIPKYNCLTADSLRISQFFQFDLTDLKLGGSGPLDKTAL